LTGQLPGGKSISQRQLTGGFQLTRRETPEGASDPNRPNERDNGPGHMQGTAARAMPMINFLSPF